MPPMPHSSMRIAIGIGLLFSFFGVAIDEDRHRHRLWDIRHKGHVPQERAKQGTGSACAGAALG